MFIFECVCLCVQLAEKPSFINNYVFGHPTRDCLLIKNPAYPFCNAVNFVRNTKIKLTLSVISHIKCNISH